MATLKERYFDQQTIEEVAGLLLQSVRSTRDRHLQSVDPNRCALLILDLQRYFLDEPNHAFIPSAPAILPRIRLLKDAFTAARAPVIATRHVNTNNNAGMMGTWWRELLTSDDSRSSLPEWLDDGSLSACICKSQYDAFYQTDLENRLRELGIDQVVISGVMTHLCCETTARSAFTRGFEVFFGIDFTATYNRSFHQATLLNLAHGFAVPVLSSEILNKFARKIE